VLKYGLPACQNGEEILVMINALRHSLQANIVKTT